MIDNSSSHFNNLQHYNNYLTRHSKEWLDGVVVSVSDS